MKLLKTIKFKGVMELVTGLAIKATGNELGIGGADSEVIKNPITGLPYIPGSSLKGKLRALTELKEGKGIDGSPCRCGRKNCMVCTIYGAHRNPKAESNPTRIIVRDCKLTEESVELIDKMPLEKEYLEVKGENSINRKTGTAESPRFIERVAGGLQFHIEILLQIFEGDKEEQFKEEIEKAIGLLEDSYLGGNGSRGYGQVKITGKWE